MRECLNHCSKYQKVPARTLVIQPSLACKSWVTNVRYHILLEMLRERDACDWAVVRAIAEIGDETAIPDLIDTIPEGGFMDAEARFKAIEEITGLSLDAIRKEWGLLYYGKLEQFHKAMHEWWQANEHWQRQINRR